MTSSAPRPGTLAFNSNSVIAAERFEAFHEEFARRFVGLDFQQGDAPFRAQIELRAIGPLGYARISISEVGFARTDDRLRDGDDSVLLNVKSSGRSILEQRAFASDSLADFGSIICNGRRGGGSFVGDGIAIRIPPAVLAPYVPQSRMFAPVSIPRGGPLARLLASYVVAFDSIGPDAGREIETTVAQHIVDLVALAMGASGDAREAIEAGGVRAARRRAALDEIARGYASPGFSAEAVAATLGISERYLRQLLEETGGSFTSTVLEHRLQRARQFLSDRRCAHLRISDIAYDAGFSDLSYFNRAFRRRFEASPSDIRAR